MILGLLLSGNANAEILKYECIVPSMKKMDYVNFEINFNTNQIKSVWSTKGKVDSNYNQIRSVDETKIVIWDSQYKSLWWFNYATNQRSEGKSDNWVVNYNCIYDKNKLQKFLQARFNTKELDKPKKEKPKQSPDDDKIVPAGSGSGFFVSKDGHAITNYHVIEGCDINKLSFKGSQTEVKVLAVDKVNDIAILKSNTKPDVIFPVSNEDVSLLEDVIVAGFPLGKQISSAIKTHKGVVTALAGAGDNYSFFQTDAAINQGNSGGPIINQKGNVVGIAVATWVEEGVQGVHFGIKSSTLKTFASANGISFASPNYRELSNKDLGKLITKGTVYVECHMTVAKIKKMIAEANNRKAFFSEYR